MFKKHVTVLQKRQLSGKDVKQIRRDIQVQFPALTEEELNELLPAKAQPNLLKLSNRAQAYQLEDQIIFFDPEGRGQILVPGMSTLWRYPHILPKIQTWSEVSPKILGGADLFLQGLVGSAGVPEFRQGDLMSVVVPGNQLPFAVGFMEVGIEAARQTGFKGKGLKVLHSFGDLLWALGDKTPPDPSFQSSRIYPMEVGNSTESSENATNQQSTEQAAARLQNLSVSAEAAPQAPSDPSAAGEGTSNGTHAAQSHSEQSESRQQGDEKGVDSEALSPDQLVEFCLVAGLHALKDKDLPIMTSDFYSKFMVPTKPEGSVIDFKKSSYKKLSKLLQSYEKKGLLKQKLVHKQEVISAVKRDHELYTSATKSVKEATSQSSAQSNEPSTSGQRSTLEISACYRVPSSLKPIFVGVVLAGTDLYSEQQVRDALQEYCTYNKLLPDDPSCYKLDRLMVGNLFNKKDPVIEGNPHPRKDLEERLISKLQLFHRVVRTPPEGVAVEMLTKGKLQEIQIEVEDRMGGRKHATKIKFLETFALDPDEVAGSLQRKFQTSASVQKIPGKNETRKEIQLQGDVLKQAAAFLASEFGIEAKYISQSSKAKGSK